MKTKEWTMIYVTVCKNTVLQNIRRAKNGKRLVPPLRISLGKYGKPQYAHTVKIVGVARVVYAPSDPLPWGARAWVQVVKGMVTLDETRR